MFVWDLLSLSVSSDIDAVVRQGKFVFCVDDLTLVRKVRHALEYGAAFENLDWNFAIPHWNANTLRRRWRELRKLVGRIA
jgi:hypothetical protein